MFFYCKLLLFLIIVLFQFLCFMKVAVFIDNSNTFKNIQSIRQKTGDKSWICLYDPLELAKKLAGNRELVSVNFYCVHPPTYLLKEDERHKRIYAITNRYYAAIEKLSLLKVKYGYLKGTKGDLEEKNLDTQLSVDLIKKAAFGEYDVAIIVSSDGDYTSAVQTAKEFKKKVELLFFRGSASMNLKGDVDLIRRARKSFFQPLKFNKDGDEGGAVQ